MKFPVRILAVTALLVGLLVPAARGVLADANLIANPSAEAATNGLPTGWLQGSWGSNTPQFTYTTGAAEDGEHALEVTMSHYASGDAKWYFQPVSVTAGSAYEFSDYYQATIPTDVIVQAEDANGVYTYIDLGTQAASTGWSEMSASFTVPTADTSVTVFHVIAGDGTLITDNYSLSETNSASPVPALPTAIQNPLLTQTAAGLPVDWASNAWGDNTTYFTYLTASHGGSDSVQVTTSQYASGDAKWYFNPVAVTPDTQYLFSDWYTASLPSTVIVAFTMADGSTQYLTLGTTGATSPWLQYASTFTAPTGAQSATVYHLIQGVGSLTTSDFALAPYTPSAGTNLLVNASLAISAGTAPADWTPSVWGTNTTAFSYNATGSQPGDRSVGITVSQYASGDAQWYPAPVAVTPDTQYLFTDYYRSAVQTEVEVAFTMSDGSTEYQMIGLPGPASTWTEFTAGFAVPLGAQCMTIYHLIQSTGTLTIDDASLSTYQPEGFSQALVTLTFDDGYASTYNAALPLLKQDGFSSTQYIITDLVGTSGYMTSADIKSLENSGQEIASHTVTHDDLVTETPAQYTKEMADSKAYLQNLTGQAVTDFAYPEGLYNAAIQSATKQYYSSARGVEDGLNAKDNFNAQDIKVQNVFSTTTTAQIADWVKQAKDTNTWLVLVYHSVDTNPNDPGTTGIYNVTPSQLSSQLAAIKSSGVTVVTMQKALKEVLPQL